MNVLDATVREIKGDPYKKYGKWWVDVISDCWGSPTETSLFFPTKEEAEQLTVGYVHVC
jgi:hypothetical protein